MNRRVFLVGEGSNDVGSYSGSAAYHDPNHAGVVGALLRKLREAGWEIVGGCAWKNLRSLRAHGSSRGDEGNVAAAALRATDYAADVLLFVRDTDGDKQRLSALERGIESACSRFAIEVVGGIADPMLEAWVLALRGELNTEGARKGEIQKRAADAGLGDKDGAAMCQWIASADLSGVPADATRLRNWLSSAERALEAR
jgi:hypothetical protein